MHHRESGIIPIRAGWPVASGLDGLSWKWKRTLGEHGGLEVRFFRHSAGLWVSSASTTYFDRQERRRFFAQLREVRR